MHHLRMSPNNLTLFISGLSSVIIIISISITTVISNFLTYISECYYHVAACTIFSILDAMIRCLVCLSFSINFSGIFHSLHAKSAVRDYNFMDNFPDAFYKYVHYLMNFSSTVSFSNEMIFALNRSRQCRLRSSMTSCKLCIQRK